MNEKKRQRTEQHCSDSQADQQQCPSFLSAGSPPNQDEAERLFGELHMQRIKLEQQNEELRLARIEVEVGLQKYYDLYDFAPVGYCTIDKEGMVRESNLAGSQLLGVDRSRLLNRCIGDFVSKKAQSDLTLFFERVFSKDNKATGEIDVPGGETGERHLYLEGAAFEAASGERLGRIAMMDVTESRQVSTELEHYRYHLEELVQQRTCQLEAANIQLREQAENLVSIYQALDSIGLVVCTLAKDDAFIDIFSAGAEKLFGYRQEEAIGKSIALIYPGEDQSIFPEQIKNLGQGQALQSSGVTLIRKSGECFPAVVSIHPFGHHKGRFTKAVGGFRDISELMLAQEQLQAINNDLERRVEERTRELQEAQTQYMHAEKLSAIGKLSASIAHEFNNPLQSILSILKGLKKRAVMDEEDRQLLDAAIGESDRIKDLIRNLQDFNRPSTGRKTVVDVHASLNSVLLLHTSEFKGKRISVELDYAERLPRILAVPDQIKQVFLNLLTNAADACQHPGGVITVRTRQIDEMVAVTIADSGVGIRHEDMEHVFQPFYTTKPEVKGTGLGLSVSYGIVKNHQGKIQVESRPGEGATFTVLLPIRGGTDAFVALD
jgi:PAS domain S-box-containing protein